MNRKDFIKSLIVGAAIAPAVVKAAEEVKAPELVDTRVDWKKTRQIASTVNNVPKDAVRIQCSGYRTTKEVEYLDDFYDSHFAKGKPYVVDVSTAIYGVSLSEFNPLLEAMNSRRDQFFIEFTDDKGWKNAKSIRGLISKMEIDENEMVMLEIVHC